jgi:hypothetical protein
LVLGSEFFKQELLVNGIWLIRKVPTPITLPEHGVQCTDAPNAIFTKNKILPRSIIVCKSGRNAGEIASSAENSKNLYQCGLASIAFKQNCVKSPSQLSLGLPPN